MALKTALQSQDRKGKPGERRGRKVKGLTRKLRHGRLTTEAAVRSLRIEAATPLKRERRKATGLPWDFEF